MNHATEETRTHTRALMTIAAVTVIAALFLGMTALADDSDAATYTYTSGNCTVELDYKQSSNSYDMRVYKTPGAPDGNMADYTGFSDVPWSSYRTNTKTLTIEDGVTHIGDFAFNVLRIPSVTIPDSVVTIGNNAFNTSSLVSVNLPSGLVSLGNSAFYSCSTLTSVTLPDSVISIGHTVFAECRMLNSVSLNPGLVTLGLQVFRSCTSLTEITIPSTVTTIGTSAFSSCTALREVTLGQSMTIMDDRLFDGCTSLKDVTIPPNTTSIKDAVFNNCTSLKTIVIPSSVTTVNAAAFTGCALETVLNLSNVDVSGLNGFQNATIKSSFEAPALIEQSEIKDVVIGKKGDAASRLLLALPVVILLGLLVWFAAPYLRNRTL